MKSDVRVDLDGVVFPSGKRVDRMNKTTKVSRFKAKLLSPAKPGRGGDWLFIVLPKTASEGLPRRGRTTVDGTMSGVAFQATLEPDGQLSHWLKVGKKLREAADVKAGDVVALEIAPTKPEPEPKVPKDLLQALAACPDAKAVWDDATTIARVDWVHWVESAKQLKTRKSRIANACDMLASGKRRVCCFDQSGFYSKSLSAPEAAD